MKGKPLIFTLAAVVIVAVAVGATVLSRRSSSPSTSTTSIIDENAQQQKVEDVTKPITEESSTPTVSLPQEEDIIRTFFNLINDGRPADAVAMMTQAAVGNDSSKQAWGVQFNSFKSVSVKKIDSSMQEEWTATKHTYKVTLDVQMKPEAENAQPMPYYGWGNGEFTRWVSLEKVDNLWKIAGIATGP